MRPRGARAWAAVRIYSGYKRRMIEGRIRAAVPRLKAFFAERPDLLAEFEEDPVGGPDGDGMRAEDTARNRPRHARDKHPLRQLPRPRLYRRLRQGGVRCLAIKWGLVMKG